MIKVISEKDYEEFNTLQELKAKQAKYSSSINQYKLEGEKIQREIKNSKDRATLLDKDIGDLELQKKKLGTEMDTLKQKSGVVSGEYSELLKKVQGVKVEYKNEVTVVQNDLSDKKKTLENVSTVLVVNKEDLVGVEKKIKNKSLELEKVTGLFNSKVSNFNLILEKLEESARDKNLEIAEKNRKLSKLDNLIESSSLRSQRIADRLKKDLLESEAMEKSIEDLSTSKKNLGEEITILMKDRDEVKKELEMLISKRISIAQRAESLKGKELYIMELYKKAGINFPQ